MDLPHFVHHGFGFCAKLESPRRRGGAEPTDLPPSFLDSIDCARVRPPVESRRNSLPPRVVPYPPLPSPYRAEPDPT
ncbi:hypothetical protein BJ508DRAFT_147315 [Ascobolus immersus RN42]|uniref:Uncharacterized protein n=1 Tax=Ascobolus immersus RN42 TaxID=1160509 RepID=A0A3N4IK16_ASCIM|nr:hypothetical protein BJ508DRAFT_147315 [Ascobolus immersus RN42]